MTKNQFKKFVKESLKMPKEAGWLLPGLEVKRWFSLIIIGTSLAILGLCIIMNLKPIYWLVSILLRLVRTIPS